MKEGDTALSQKFAIKLDYDQSLEQMVVAGHYDWVGEYITSENFHVDYRQSGEVMIYIVNFDQPERRTLYAAYPDLIAKLDTIGLRAAELPELLALGAAYPDLQRQFSILALGSVWQTNPTERFAPYLGGSDSSRHLSQHWFDYQFLSYHIAAVSK